MLSILRPLAIFVAALGAGYAAEPRLILLSIDGLKPETLRSAEKASLKLPNLIEMRDKGAFSEGLVGVFPTVTYPSHTAMVTGKRPAESGIYSNGLFDPENKKRGMWFYFSEALQSPTLWQAAQKQGKTVGAVSWPVTVGASIDFNLPEFTQMNSEDQIMLQRAVSTKGLFAESEKEVGQVHEGTKIDDHFRANQAAYILRAKKPDLMLVHLIDLDHEQHLHGVGSPQANHALEEIDKAVGTIRRAIGAAGATDSTSWIIVSDHGFWPVEEAFHSEAFLDSLGVATWHDKSKGWRIASHANGGSVAFVSQDPNDTQGQRFVLDTLRQLAGNPKFGIDRVLDRAQLAELKAYPHAFAAISLKRGFTSGSARSGAWVTPSGSTAGMHGYLPGPPELDATFLAFGPGIAARSLPRGELTDVAKTAALLLGISMPSATGRNLLAPVTNRPAGSR